MSKNKETPPSIRSSVTDGTVLGKKYFEEQLQRSSMDSATACRMTKQSAE